MELYYIEMSLQMRNWLKDHRKKVQEALVMEGYIYIYILQVVFGKRRRWMPRLNRKTGDDESPDVSRDL